MKITSAVSGLHVRLDVKTKCEIVKEILTKRFTAKGDINVIIRSMADAVGVNPVTIRLWISKYEHTYPYGLTLPDGVMSYSFLTIPQAKLSKVRTDLTAIRNQLTSLRKSHEVSSISVPAATIRNWKPSSLILDKLVDQPK